MDNITYNHGAVADFASDVTSRSITAQQPMQGSSTRTRQSGDENRANYLHPDMFWIPLPRRLAEQPCHQGITQEEPRHLAADFGEIGVPAVRIEKHTKGFPVVVIVGAEILEADGLRRRGVQVFNGADIGTRHQALYSPQLTSNV